MDYMEIIVIICSSTVVAAIISSISGKLMSEKENHLKYITSERKNWRETIRKMAAMLPTSDVMKVRSVIDNLELHLNPYGKYEKDKYLKDSHIWEKIDSIRSIIEDKDNKVDQDGLFSETMRLKEYLELLLKFDWERSKREVKANWYRRWIIIAELLMFALMTGAQFINIGYIDEYYYIGLMLLMLYPAIYGFLSVDGDKDKSNKVNKCVLTITVAACAFTVIKHLFVDGYGNLDDLILWYIPVVIVAALIFGIIKLGRMDDYRNEYYETIKELSGKGSIK